MADGKPLGGRYRLFGYNRDWSVNEGEAAIVREVFSRARSGESHGSISRDLRMRDIRTVTGGQWVPLQTARLLRTQRYAGRSVHNGQVVGNSQVTPLVSEVDFEAVQRPTPGQTRGRARKYLLSGFLVCGACKATMSGSNGRYRCDPAMGGCGTVGIKADWVDWPIGGRVASLHQQVRVGEPFESRDYQAELDETDRRIESLHERHRAGDLDMEDLVVLLKEERRKRMVTVASLAEDTSEIDRFLRGLEEFETADISVKREIVARYLKYIVISPSGKGRQPHQSRGRITVTWRNNSTENLLTDTPRLDYRWVL
nr:recombinase family protein [Nocardioides sp. zg-1230]